MSASNPKNPAEFSREEFEKFLHALTHELRNQLNAISLEVTDLAEQAGPQIDAVRVQQQVRECSTLLKKVRESLAPDDPKAEKMTLSEMVKKLREKNL